jgi:hypothetical protein
MCKAGAYLDAVFIASNLDHPQRVMQEARQEAGIPVEYEDLKEIFSKTKAQIVAKIGWQDLTINLVKGNVPL